MIGRARRTTASTFRELTRVLHLPSVLPSASRLGDLAELVSPLTMLMTTSAAFLPSVLAPFALITAIVLIDFDLAKTQKVETFHR